MSADAWTSNVMGAVPHATDGEEQVEVTKILWRCVHLLRDPLVEELRVVRADELVLGAVVVENLPTLVAERGQVGIPSQDFEWVLLQRKSIVCDIQVTLGPLVEQPHDADADADADNKVLMSLVRWVEEEIVPEYVRGANISLSTPGSKDFTRKHCKWPKRNIYTGPGHFTEEDAWKCV
ncbi:hypothetical protein BO71DRAFT_437617 [Aspergillus ellipticus CBS 707.79]|uniref:feruloyl esterase n=1 Tax=Aspergillus ellipticus CBS 707.79 TaxID=1448320 RepID=A0A319DNC1_9EURO|nr:hypothetical protein BO71DRAFT_437617 [Aspergillus ellipticus CBS 707.79]